MVRNKLFIVFGLFIVAAGVGIGIFVLGYTVGQNHSLHITVSGVSDIDKDKPDTIDFGTFWQVWKLVNDNYLRNANVSNQDKVYGAINGLVQSLKDPYSSFFTPTDNKSFQEDVQGSFGGIGAELGMKKNQLVIISPLKDTPASHAGLQPGDAILAINGSSTDNLALDQAVTLIRGPENTPLKLTVFRETWDKPKVITIIRARIDIPTLDYEMKPGQIAYIHLYSFNGNASRLFDQATSEADAHHAKGIIFDLRNDPGGYLDVAVDLAGWFVPRGTVVVSEATRTGITDKLQAGGNEKFANIPVVVLINKGSASASEILAGALRDLRGAPLVGEQSFGKGTVQTLEELPDGSSLKITIAHWVLPKGQILENGGLQADYEVKMTDDDIAQNKDPQLDKAIEILKTKIQ